jgi:16S rRNA (cytidine1402-2'-O)-methyltransferase
LAAGESLALISDAGTPLVSDPGYRLVRAARAAGVPVSPVPGACAAIAALSVAGLPSDRFIFEGFLPAKASARREHLARLAGETGTLVFYEASHRIAESLADMRGAFGGDRPAVIARELTKLFETIHGCTLAEAAGWLSADPVRRKGEFVLIVEGAAAADEPDRDFARRALTALLAELPVRQAVDLAVKITGGRRNALYALALQLKKEMGNRK